MEARHLRIERLQRVLSTLEELQAVASLANQAQVRLWLSLAIEETVSQIARARIATIH